jgi:hypothetical protein
MGDIHEAPSEDGEIEEDGEIVLQDDPSPPLPPPAAAAPPSAPFD